MNEIDSYYEAQQWAALAPFIWVVSIIFGILTLWALIVVIVAGHRYLSRTAKSGSIPINDEVDRRIAASQRARGEAREVPSGRRANRVEE